MTKFVQLTDLEGRTIWIAPAWVISVRHPVPGENGKAAIVYGSKFQMVKETPQEAVKILIEA